MQAAFVHTVRPDALAVQNIERLHARKLIKFIRRTKPVPVRILSGRRVFQKMNLHAVDDIEFFPIRARGGDEREIVPAPRETDTERLNVILHPARRVNRQYTREHANVHLLSFQQKDGGLREKIRPEHRQAAQPP